MRRALYFVLFAAIVPLAARPQQLTFETSTTTAPAGAPVLNKPYTAHKQMHEERTLADGTKTTAEFDLLEARDVSGATASTLHQLSGAGQGQLSTLEMHFVFSPAARTMLQWNNLNQVAQVIHLPPVPVRLDAGNGPKPEQLGHRVIAGYAATGTRTETQTPGAVAGSTSPLRTSLVLWHSDALQADLERTTVNPKNGTVAVTLVDLHEGPPDPALFHLPEGYTVKEVGPKQPASAASPVPDDAHLPAMTYDEATAKLNDADTAPVAAAVLMKLESTDTDLERRDKAVYSVVRKGLSLEAAETLAKADVTAGEQAMTQTALPPSPSALRAEHHLARYWDTLGYTLDREHKDGTVYLLAAWTLDPLAFYGSHLGRDYEHAHMDADAIAIYRQAQNAEGSADMKQTIADRLAALAGPPKPAPASAPAGPVAHAVAAVFYTAGGKPQVRFLTGADAVGDAGATTADQAATMWKLPDSGPEQVVRLVAIDCGGTGGCTSSNLPARLP